VSNLEWSQVNRRSALQCCSALQCVAVCSSLLRCVKGHGDTPRVEPSELSRPRCNVLAAAPSPDM